MSTKRASPSTRPVSLHDIAPRLAQARDDALALRAWQYKELRRLGNTLWNLEWLVAHRELEEIRVLARGRRANVAHTNSRRRKLDRAKKDLARVKKKIERIKKMR